MISFNTLPASVPFQNVNNVYAFKCSKEMTYLEILLCGQHMKEKKTSGIFLFPRLYDQDENGCFYVILYNTFNARAYDIYRFMGGKMIHKLDSFSTSILFKMLGIDITESVNEVTSYVIDTESITRTDIFA